MNRRPGPSDHTDAALSACDYIEEAYDVNSKDMAKARGDGRGCHPCCGKLAGYGSNIYPRSTVVSSRRR